MKKKFIVIAEILCLVFLVGGALYIHFNGPEKVDFSGTLLYRDNEEFVLLEMDSKKAIPAESIIEEDGVVYARDVKFFEDKTRFITESSLGCIEMFDVESNEFTKIYQAENPYGSRYEFEFVDDEHIAIIEGNSLKIVNILNGEKTVVADDANTNSEFACAGDGKTIYYVSSYELNEDKKNKICKINIETGEKVILVEGISVECSADGRYFAYNKYQSGIFRSKSVLTVVDTIEGTEWTFNIPVYDFCFSPNGGSLALISEWRGLGTSSAPTLRIWDFQNDKTQVVLEQIPTSDIDWIG